jgi:hypothetical protein
MKRKLSAVEARKQFGEVLDGVHYRGDEVVIERAGKVMAVVIPEWLYRNIERSRDELMRLIEMNWEYNKDVPPEEIEEAIAEAVREVRAQERHESDRHHD